MRSFSNESKLVIVVGLVAVVCAGALSFIPSLPVVLATFCGTVLVGITPGYAWTYALFRRTGVTVIDRLLIGVPLSIVLTATSTFAISSFLHVAWTPLIVRLMLLAIVIAGSAVALFLDKPTHQ